MTSLKKSKQIYSAMHQEKLMQASGSSENDSTNVLTPKWYHPTTYLDWMAQGSAAAKS